jgi:uncharacterized protein (DUF58 family)
MLKAASPPRPKSIEDLLDARLIAQIERLDITSRKMFSGKLIGERRSKKRGQSVEFADHRAYVMGDDLRRIDWNIYGRLDRLFMKVFLEEEDLGLHVVIDSSASCDTGEPSKYLFMQKAAMALGYIGLVNMNRVAATTMGDAEGSVAGAIKDLRGRRRTQDLSRFICSIEPQGGYSFREAAERIALSRRGKGVMVIFSDFLFKDGYESGLRLLTGRGYDVICVQVLSPQEVDPPIAGDLRLKDVEDGDFAEVTIAAPLLKKYKATVAAYCQQLQEFCTQRDMGYLFVKSDLEIDKLLLDYLRRRGVLQ